MSSQIEVELRELAGEFGRFTERGGLLINAADYIVLLETGLKGAEKWTEDDVEDQYTPLISAAHPMRTGDHEHFRIAQEMVHNRRSKYALVELVAWILRDRDRAIRLKK